MKKIDNILFILFLTIIGIGVYSCTDELNKSDFDYKPDPSVGLATIQFNTLEKVTDETVLLSATITSTGESPFYDQGFIYSTDQSFTTYSTLPIIPGKDEPNQLDTIIGIDQGKDFYFKAFVLTRDGLVTSADVKSINLPITWEKVGTVIFTDDFWNKEAAEVEIQKFFGQNKYRLVDLYNRLTDLEEASEDDIIPAGKHLVFYLDDDANAEGFPIGDQDILIPPYMFFWDNVNLGNYCYFTNNANIYTIGALAKVNGEIKYVFKGSFEWIDGYPGDIPEPVDLIEVNYKTDFSDESARAGWVLDIYSGTGDDDLVFFFDMAKVDVPSWGTAIATYHEKEPLKIISPSVTIAENDTLSFGLYAGLFESQVNAKVKLFIREVGGVLNLNAPIKDWDLAEGGEFTAIPLDAYEGKEIKVIFVVEQGDFLFYKFAIAPSSNQSLIFQ